MSEAMAAPMAPIPLALERNAKMVATLSDQIKTLEARLTPVLGPVPQSGQGDSKAQVVDKLVSTTIDIHSSRLAAISADVSAILERLQL